MEDTEVLSRLRADVAALREELAAVRAQLDARAGSSVTMRRDARCPGCGGRKLLLVAEIVDRAHGGKKTFGVATRGFLDRTVGQFEVVVCAACRLVEWYVDDPSRIRIDGKKVRVVDETAPAGEPYR